MACCQASCCCSFFILLLRSYNLWSSMRHIALAAYTQAVRFKADLKKANFVRCCEKYGDQLDWKLARKVKESSFPTQSDDDQDSGILTCVAIRYRHTQGLSYDANPMNRPLLRNLLRRPISRQVRCFSLSLFREIKTDEAPTPERVLSMKSEWVPGVKYANPQEENEDEQQYVTRIRRVFLNSLPYVCGFSATPWIKELQQCSSNDDDDDD